MEKILDKGAKICFNSIQIIIISSIYFYIVPMNIATEHFGLILALLYFGTFIYMGYRAKMGFKDGLLLGIVASFVGIFLGIFAIYLYFVSQQPNSAIWVMMPYFIPTMSIKVLFNIEINFLYPVILMVINILLVAIGSYIGYLNDK